MKITPVSITQEASLWSLPAEDPVLSWAILCGICVEQSGTRIDFSPSAMILTGENRSTQTDFCPSTSVFPCQIHCANAHIQIQFALTRSTSGRNLEAFQKAMLFRKSRTVG